MCEQYSCFDCIYRQIDIDGTIYCNEGHLRIISDAWGEGDAKVCEKYREKK